jgi:hypothetical protein
MYLVIVSQRNRLKLLRACRRTLEVQAARIKHLERHWFRLDRTGVVMMRHNPER